MKRLSNEDLTAIRERAEEATEGPWVGDGCDYVNGAGGELICDIDGDHCGNTYFIAHAREDIPKMLEEIERLRELLNKAYKYGISSEAYQDEKVIEEIYEYLYGGDDE